MQTSVNPTLNYAKDSKERMPLEHYLGEFKKVDPIEVSNRLGIPFNEETSEFTITFMGTTYDIKYPEYEVSHREDDKLYYPVEDSHYAKILIIRYLMNGHKTYNDGRFLAYREVPDGEVYVQQFSGRCMGRLAGKYGWQLPKLEKIMLSAGATKVDFGDMAYDIEFMDDLYVRFILWRGDEEFSASSQILFSSNFPASFSAEDLAIVGDVCINTFGKIEKKL